MAPSIFTLPEFEVRFIESVVMISVFPVPVTAILSPSIFISPLVDERFKLSDVLISVVAVPSPRASSRGRGR